MVKRTKGVVTGIVQGVGFRPFVYQLANRYGLAGHVVNTASGVDLEVEGPEEEIDRFFEALASERPPLAYIDSVERAEMPAKRENAFEIRKSLTGRERSTLISPDVSVCPDCLSELKDPGDRRHGYPFINCTNCGPRYTIITDIPYDRVSTTMKKFQMCAACLKEYEDPSNRRFHAQPNACWECGPRLALNRSDGRPVECPDPVQETIRLLEQGFILAIKGLGGFHLAVDAADHRAVVRLRRRKHREEKPLAVMVRDLEAAREIAHVSDAEAETLTSHQRPIVVLRKRRFHRLSPQVAPRNKSLGVMLPYTPLHALLLDGPFRALVMTSGNMTEEPIAIDNQEAFSRLGEIADYFLMHNRDIYLRSDDSVVRVVDRIPRQIRRSRGYVPVPVFLKNDLIPFPPVLALGGELKNTVCLTKNNRAFISQHIGDMENLETYEFFRMTIAHLERILEIRPRLIAHDLHPDYLSSKYAEEQEDFPARPVQHHHAHIVSCLSEQGSKGPVIGVALDGTGLGEDGRIWGGEVLLADLVSYRRAAHLEYLPLPGGDAAARFPWRMALVYLDRAYGEGLFDLALPFVRGLDRKMASNILKMARKGVNSPLTSSCGRLFDAVSALLGIRGKIAYEGQAAVELEMSQSGRATGGYFWRIEKENDPWILDVSGMIKGITEDILQGAGRGVISRRFHYSLTEMFAAVCCELREETGLDEVAFSGGAFQNMTLLAGLAEELTSNGFRVMSHARVPTNDGGLALGQAVCAGLREAGFKGRFEKDHESDEIH